jgi:hypothetical protein
MSKNLLYGVQSPIKTHERPKIEFVSNEILMSRVTYMIRNFTLSSKKYALRGLKIQTKIMGAQKRESLMSCVIYVPIDPQLYIQIVKKYIFEGF